MPPASKRQRLNGSGPSETAHGAFARPEITKSRAAAAEAWLHRQACESPEASVGAVPFPSLVLPALFDDALLRQARDQVLALEFQQRSNDLCEHPFMSAGS